MSTKYTCCARIHSNFIFYACGKAAKFERDGKHYCGTHDPVSIAEKRAIKDAVWKAKYDEIAAVRDAVKATQAEIERRADCYPELLEALQTARSIVLAQNGNRHDDTNKAIAMFDAAIAKALGEQA